MDKNQNSKTMRKLQYKKQETSRKHTTKNLEKKNKKQTTTKKKQKKRKLLLKAVTCVKLKNIHIFFIVNKYRL